ncbi:MAG TPA: hypothetical protein VEY67_01755 [Candidatus Dormibacteraeota bacterium]|nr:hypothetical protein [Candidatus Dormibacteraeota bacterium]
MATATVLILHPAPPPEAGPLMRCLTDLRAEMAEVHRAGFEAAGADEVRIVSEPADDTPFGARLRRLSRGLRGGLVVLGSGSMPLATAADRAAFVRVAASGEDAAIANSRYSADIVAIGRAGVLEALPDLDADNALPRWLSERAGLAVSDLSSRWHLAVDLDGPLDALLVARHPRAPAAVRIAATALVERGATVLTALDGVARVLADRRSEVLVAGRTSGSALRWLERSTAARIRALIEERGLRAASELALDRRPERPRPPASTLGMLLDRSGPSALGSLVASLGDAAVIDTRVLLAHRLGRDQARWPSAEDRFASDLLQQDAVTDPWLRDLTSAAAGSHVPIVLGGHTVAGPGIRLVARGARPLGREGRSLGHATRS